MPKPKISNAKPKPKPNGVKPLNDKIPSYKQKLQFDMDFKKSVEREKIKPKELFDLKKKNGGQKNKY